MAENPVPAHELAARVAARQLNLSIGLHWEQARFDRRPGFRRAWAVLDMHGNTIVLTGGRDDGSPTTDGEVAAEWHYVDWDEGPAGDRLLRLSPYGRATNYHTHTGNNTLAPAECVRYEQPPLPADYLANPALQAAVAFSGLTSYVLNNPVAPYNIVCEVRNNL